MSKARLNSFSTQRTLKVGGNAYQYQSLPALAEAGFGNVSQLPYSIKILLENLLRHEDGIVVTQDHIKTLANWKANNNASSEIFFMPARVLLQDFTGVPAVADLAAMRNAIKRLGGDPAVINPYTPADLVIDHSVQVDHFGSSHAFAANAEFEFTRNIERYKFLRWGQNAFNDFRVVPPDSGIVHQVNLEYLAHVVMTRKDVDDEWIYPDTLVGTDSHSTMINGLGVLGWGVGGIEAEAALLGQPSSLLIPKVVGMRLLGSAPAGTTATDTVLAITQRLRNHGVVGKFVEFYGPGLVSLSLADRATIANMAPEYGATCGLFPVDEKTTDYMRLTGRDEAQIERTIAYFKAQKLWYNAEDETPQYSEQLDFDLASVEPCLAGPTRPQDRVPLSQVRKSFRHALIEHVGEEASVEQHAITSWLGEGGQPMLVAPELAHSHPDEDMDVFGLCVPVRQPDGMSYNMCHGSVVIAAITSCTNTSNPSVMLAAGLIARNAVRLGLRTKPWVKTSLAPGSKVVTDYLNKAGVMPYLEALGFHLVGYGCTTCIGNSGPLAPHIGQAIQEGDLAAAAVLSGNRNFEGRVNALVRANYLASPPLVVAYALAGNVNIDLTSDPLGADPSGELIYLKDIWPSNEEIEALIRDAVTTEQFKTSYKDIFEGSERWAKLDSSSSELFDWDKASTYIKEPPFFSDMGITPEPLEDINNAYILVHVGDSVTTDHISPAGSIAVNSPAGRYLINQGVKAEDFNSYGARRGNHEVMVRGTFANIRLRNKLVPGVEGGETLFIPDNKQMSIFDASKKYQEHGIATIVIAGKEYGTGSSRDWAAKGPKLLGIRAVIAESYERIHRSNLIGMGILPLQFNNGENAETLGLKTGDRFSIKGIATLDHHDNVKVSITSSDGSQREFHVVVRIDTPNEVEYFRHGGILPYVLREAL
ncbi:MAG: aconitate hydratase AcnA [Gammaproteobacteria bacterium]|nr:aconitate hydratase AcnA [Gammaproteobacteria bacterium]PCH63485.1 MAG: aconitate hydratase AcnA [Gammaproteobacteria bacterium]